MQPRIKRVFDLAAAALGLLLLSPLLGLIALWIKASDGGPVFFRQERVGQHGRLFRIWKFRTMVVGAEHLGPSLTEGGDPRVTRVGRWLRLSKLDELPQLWNVLVGEMSLVGPRPEVPRYVALYTPEQREIFKHKPGITDLASLLFREEETLLQGVQQVEDFYIRYCLPKKLELNRSYAERAGILQDLAIILQTLTRVGLDALARLCTSWRASLMAATQNSPPHGQRLAIVGPGKSASELALDLADKQPEAGQVVAIFDDNPHTWRTRPHGILVVGMPECLLNPQWQKRVDEVILALPRDQGHRREELGALLKSLPLKVSVAATDGFARTRSEQALILTGSIHESD